MHAPINTARHVALLRAAHQIREEASVFDDPYAFDIIGMSPDAVLQTEQASQMRRGERLFVAARSRFAEDRAARAVREGVRQIVILGAGYDTYSLRAQLSDGTRLFEVDHVATQSIKLKAVKETGALLSADIHFVAVDFERDDLFEKLKGEGFDKNMSTFFFWLGVVPYLREETVFALLTSLRRLPSAEIIFDYGQVPGAYSGLRRERYESMITEARDMGEPWLSFFDHEYLAAKLRALEFLEIEDLGVSEIGKLYVPTWKVPQGTPGGHIVRARYSRKDAI
jgi:methyltransferase (TIGR00027 family)